MALMCELVGLEKRRAGWADENAVPPARRRGANTCSVWRAGSR